MADLLHVQLVEVVDGEVEEAAPGHVVVQEEVRVGQDAVVEALNKWRCSFKIVNDNIRHEIKQTSSY